MPRSQTPVVSSRLAMTSTGLLPSVTPKTSAFTSCRRFILSDHEKYTFRSSVTRPAHSLHLASHTPLQDMHAGSLQIRRLTSSGGNCSASRAHPLGNNNQFHGVPSDSKVLNLTRHEGILPVKPPFRSIGCISKNHLRRPGGRFSKTMLTVWPGSISSPSR